MGEASGPFDVAVIGAGIAGASVAAELAPFCRVVLMEREAQPGYHTTGRSAALFSETYGPPAIRALSRASAAFLRRPPDGFSQTPLLAPRGVMMIGRDDQREALAAFYGEVASHARLLDAGETRRRLPLLREDYIAGAVLEEHAQDIDVHALHQGFLRRFRAAGGVTETNGDVLALGRDADGWAIATRQEIIRAGVLVNAAGAWADVIADMAGAARIGLVPKRRTVLIVAAPQDRAPEQWPMAVDIDEKFYLKPESGHLLVSPADETPSPPCDAQPEELDVAICVDRIQKAFDIEVRHIENKWAGLRNFVADKAPVAGFDPIAPDFFWLAGQGGYGIQSAPALARLAAASIRQVPLPGDLADHGVDPRALAPARAQAAASLEDDNEARPMEANGRRS